MAGRRYMLESNERREDLSAHRVLDEYSLNFSEEEFTDKFGMSRKTFKWVLKRVSQLDQRQQTHRHPISTSELLCAVLA